MKTSFAFFMVLALLGFSCSKTSDEPSDQSETLRLINESMRKIVDLQLTEAIQTDEQRGRNNENLIAKLKQLAGARKNLDFEDLRAVEVHVSRLKTLRKDQQEMFVRVNEYLAQCQSDPQKLPLLKAEVSLIEFDLVQDWSRQLGIVDCCFPSPINVQTKGAIAGEVYEMAIFPNGDRALWDKAAYTYANIFLTQAGSKVPVDIETNQIGHVMIVRFTLQEADEYALHFSVIESGDYLAESWQQDFEWPVVVR